jgi:hypothetical protein
MAADATTVTVRDRPRDRDLDRETAPAPRGDRLVAVLRRVRWPLVVTMLLGAAWTIWFVLQCKQYFIQPDELEYVKQSRLIAQELHPLLPGDRYYNSWSQLQPLLLAPVWAIHDTNLAHQVMGIVNALIMVSAAIPAYLLTRRVLPAAQRWTAYAVAFLTIAIPWMAAAATMMTEVAAYPAFLWAVLAVHYALTRPSTKGDAVGVAGVALAYFARPQLAVLGAALVVGLVVQELRYLTAGTDPLTPRRRRIVVGLTAALRRHAPLLALAAIALLGYVVLRPNLFGGYTTSGVTNGALDAPGVWEFSRELLAYVTSGTAMIPLALAIAWAVLTLARPLTPEQHAFAVIAVITGFLLTVAVGSFTARYTPQGINSRYLFYLAPLLFLGTVALIADRRPATVPLAIGGVLTLWIVYGAKLAQSGPSLVAPDQTFHTVLLGRTYELGKAIGTPHLTVPHLLALGSIALVAALAAARRTRWGRLAGMAALGVVLLFCVAESAYSLRKIADTQKGASKEFIDGRDWIDQLMPPGQTAQVILSTMGDAGSSYGVWWDTSFWNSSVDRSMQLPTTPDLQQPFPQSFQIFGDGSFAGYTSGVGASSIGGPGLGNGPWFVRAANDRTFGFTQESVVAERFGIRLIKTSTPPRAAWALYGTLDETGRIARGGYDATLRLFPAAAGATSVPVQVVLGTTPGAEKAQRFVIGDRTGRVAVGKTVTVDLDVPIGTEGFAQTLIKAPGKPDATVPRGLQVLGVTRGG